MAGTSGFTWVHSQGTTECLTGNNNVLRRISLYTFLFAGDRGAGNMPEPLYYVRPSARSSSRNYISGAYRKDR